MIAHLALVGVMLFPQSKVALPLEDPWFSPDKAKHFAIAAFVESVSFAGLEAAGANRNASFAGAVSVTAAVSLLREVHDKRVKNQFSFRDLAWDLAGGVAAFVMLRRTEKP
jgi:uncharacterized protein YfiM (DUF2279 family)